MQELDLGSKRFSILIWEWAKSFRLARAPTTPYRVNETSSLPVSPFTSIVRKEKKDEISAIQDCQGFGETALNVPCVAEPRVSDTGLAAALGGGLDIRLNKRLDLRAIQVDYNPTRLFGSTQHNIRIGIGIVIH